MVVVYDVTVTVQEVSHLKSFYRKQCNLLHLNKSSALLSLLFLSSMQTHNKTDIWFTFTMCWANVTAYSSCVAAWAKHSSPPLFTSFSFSPLKINCAWNSFLHFNVLRSMTTSTKWANWARIRCMECRTLQSWIFAHEWVKWIYWSDCDNGLKHLVWKSSDRDSWETDGIFAPFHLKKCSNDTFYIKCGDQFSFPEALSSKTLLTS